jgi:hypothetical protein
MLDYFIPCLTNAILKVQNVEAYSCNLVFLFISGQFPIKKSRSYMGTQNVNRKSSEVWKLQLYKVSVLGALRSGHAIKYFKRGMLLIFVY